MSKEHFIIYPSFGQRISSWDISSACGKYDIPLLRSIDSDSLIVYLNDNGRIQAIDYEHIHSNPLFSIGTKIAISNEINNYGKPVLGYITDINPSFIDILTETNGKPKTYRISDYKQISAYGKTNQPEYLIVNIKPEDKGELKLSYLFGDIKWKAHYTIIMDENNIEQFTLSATIINQTNEQLKGKVSLVAGSIQRPHKEQSVRLMATMESEPQPVKSHGEFEEHYKYNLEEHQIDTQKRIDLFICNDIKAQKYYLHDISSYDSVVYGYKFKAPSFLPSGDVYLYMNEYDDILYTGMSHMEEHREEDKVDLMVSKTTQVQVESNIAQTNDDNTSDISIESTVENKSEESVLITLQYYIGNDRVINVSPPITRQKNGYLQWDMMANPNRGKINISLSLSNLNSKNN